MIIYNSEASSFLLTGKGYTYVMYVNRAGYLQHLYYGKKLAKDDVNFLIEKHGKRAEPDPADINCDMATGEMPSECGSFGRGDFRSATVIVKRTDGAAMSRFKYLSHSVKSGAVKLEGMPCARKADQTLTVTLKDDFSDTEIDINYSVSDNSDILVRNAVIRNAGKDSVEIAKAYSFCMQLPDTCSGYSALRLAGSWASERKPVKTPLAEGTLRIESTRGYSSHQMNPFLAILSDDCNENNGDCFGFNLLYSGSFGSYLAGKSL